MPSSKVVIRNKLAQLVTLGITDASGTVREVKLPPNGVSEAVDADKVSAYTRRLAELGHVKISPAVA
jgi:hypothetical protein